MAELFGDLAGPLKLPSGQTLAIKRLESGMAPVTAKLDD